MPSAKDILLINPWIFDFTAYDFWLKPLGFLYIAALLEEHTPARLSFIDCLDRHHPCLPKTLKSKSDGRGAFFKEEAPKPDLLKDIPRKYSRYGIPLSLFEHEISRIPKPDLVLLTCTMTYWYPGVQLAIEKIRETFGSVPVVLGGIYASIMPEHARCATGADFVIQGSGEKLILPLLQDIFGDKFCSGQRFEALEDVPWPAFHLLRNTDSLPVLTSRGCPFRCSYCASFLLFKGFEQVQSRQVISQIEFDCKHHNAKNIAFYDDSLLLNKQAHLIPILQEIIRMQLPLHFHTPNGLHVKEVDLELARLLKRSNFQSIFLSQESLDENSLQASGAKVSPDDLEEALHHLEEADFRREEINVYLMVGIPGQSLDGIRRSILQVQSLGARPHLAYFSPLPGTSAWKAAVERGYISDNADPLMHNKLAFPYLWGEISPEDFASLKELLR